MSATLKQIYDINPASNMISTDLIYLSRSPYTPGKDFGITFGTLLTSLANLSIVGNTISSTNTDGNINLVPNGIGTVIIGGTTPFVNSLNAAQLQIISDTNNTHSGVSAIAYNDVNGGRFNSYGTSSATQGTYVAVSNTQSLGRFQAYGDDGTQFTTSSFINFICDGTPSNGIVPGAIYFYTATASGVPTYGMGLDHNQILTLYKPLPITSGGTGVSNTGTWTNGGNVTFSGAYTFTGTLSNTTSVTFPTSGTLATTSQFLNWVVAPSTPVTCAVNTGYIVTNASQVTFTLPTTAAVGNFVSIVGNGAGGWILQPGAGQTIKILTGSAGTSITSAEQYDCIDVICTVANTTWVARNIITTGVTFS